MRRQRDWKDKQKIIPPRHLQYRWFIRHLVSYLLILLIPIVLLYGIYIGRVNVIFHDEVLENLQIDLEGYSDFLDNEFQNMKSAAEQISLFLNHNDYDFEKNPLSVRPIMNILSIYQVTNHLMGDIILYLDKEDFLLSSTSTLDKELFLKSWHRYAEVSDAELSSMLQNNQTERILPGQNLQSINHSGHYVTILAPMFTDYSAKRGTCIFLISSQQLEKSIEDRLGKYSPALMIRDRTGMIIFANRHFTKKSFTKDMFPQVAGEDVARFLNHNDQRFISVTTKLMDGQGDIVLAIPQAQELTDRLNALTRSFGSWTLISILISGFLIYFSMRRTYTPLLRLRREAIRLGDGGPILSEYDTISSTLKHLDEKNIRLRKQLEDQLSTTKNQILQDFLTGRFQSIEEFNREASKANIRIPYHNFVIGCLLIHGDVSEIESIADYFCQTSKMFAVSYYVFAPTPGLLYLINSLPMRDIMEVKHCFEQVRLATAKTFSVSLTLGLSTFYDSTNKIPHAYMEASSALDYRFVKGNDQTILTSDIISQQASSIAYPHGLFEKLYQAIRGSDEALIYTAISKLITYIQENSPPLFMAKGICFDILNAFLHTDEGRDLALEDKADIFLLNDLENASEVIEIVMTLQEEFRDRSTATISDKEQEGTLPQIRDHVDQNCLDASYSAQMTAEHFGMKLSNMSKMFKEQYGLTVLEYYTKCRMDRAKELLVSTSLPLKDISLQVGYYNVSSFIRRFKQTQGITPGQFRDQANGE